MTRREIAETAAAALATAVVVTVLFWPAAVTADATMAAPAPEIVWPTLTQGDCKVTLRVTPSPFKAGDEPVVELDAVNGGDAPATIKVALRMRSTDVAAAMSRRLVPSKPEEAWQKACEITVAAGKSETLKLKTGVKVSVGRSVMFTMQVGGRAVAATPISTGPAAITNIKNYGATTVSQEAGSPS